MAKFYTLDGKLLEFYGSPTDFTGIIEYADGTKFWYLKDKLHRTDGPAAEYPDGTKYWYINSRQVSEEQHKLLAGIMKLKGLL